MNHTTPTTEALLGLRHPRRPSRARLPWQLARELPDPTHEEGWRRFTHQDTATLTEAELLGELERIRLHCLSFPEDAPTWLLERGAVLRRALEEPESEIGAA